MRYDLPRILAHTMYCPVDGSDLEWDNPDLPRKRVCSEDSGSISVYDMPNKIYGMSDHHMEYLLHQQAQNVNYDGEGISVDVLEQFDNFTYCPLCKVRLIEHPHLRMTMMCRHHGTFSLGTVDAGVILPMESKLVRPPILVSRVKFQITLDRLFLRTYRMEIV